jgi:hypothetical protein
MHATVRALVTPPFPSRFNHSLRIERGNMRTLLKLPIEMKIEILAYLDVANLTRIRLVCRHHAVSQWHPPLTNEIRSAEICMRSALRRKFGSGYTWNIFASVIIMGPHDSMNPRRITRDKISLES